MKLGCSSSSYGSSFAEGRLDLDEWLRVCAEDLELDGVELLDAHFAATDPMYLRAIKKLCADLQLTISAIAVTSDFGADDHRAREREKVKQWCDIAAIIGAPVVRVFAGWIPVKRSEVPAGRLIRAFRRVFGEPPPNARRIWSDVTAALRDCADYAAERGVVLGLQNQRGSLASTPAQVAQLVHGVGSPWMRICVDPAGFGSTAGVDALLTQAVQAHAHLRDVQEDGSDAPVVWPELLRLLRLGHFRGFLHIDYDGSEAPETAVPRAVVYLRGTLHLLDRQQLLQSPTPTPEPPPARQNGGVSAIDIVRGAFAAEVPAHS
ncbi:MAG: sugar phosphate isomerase/epimerase [Chloroflexota bacterium]|nr:sugar phosphate isomerase/epimerase [Chloroflexota bacterium]